VSSKKGPKCTQLGKENPFTVHLEKKGEWLGRGGKKYRKKRKGVFEIKPPAPKRSAISTVHCNLLG